MTEQHWKIVRSDGTTHEGFVWPLVNARAGQSPVEVVADPGGAEFTTEDPCPEFSGDGLCVALSASGASSGGIGLADCVGLLLEVDPADVLVRSADKLRARAVTVVDVWSPVAVIRAGFAKDLRWADLRRADLRRADLSGANLRGANLQGADLRGANLQGADLLGADLYGADLRGADLQGADLLGTGLLGTDLSWADLRGADLRGANLQGADLLGADLYGADLRGADLQGAEIPEGVVSNEVD